MSLHIPASANLPLAPHTVQSAREILSHQCSIMIALSVLSLLFMYNVWWMSLFTIVVASVGYYAAEMIKESTSASSLMSGDALGRSFQVGSPKLRSKRQLVLAEFFYYASILVAAFQCGGEAMMMVSMSLDMSFSPTNGWEVACMLLGSVFAIALVYTTVLHFAQPTTHQYITRARHEPIEFVVPRQHGLPSLPRRAPATSIPPTIAANLRLATPHSSKQRHEPLTTP
ncbi:hypothetical protein, variant 1 [Aphanomyces astaci]|uniref:Uncharacterized protein n=1 Tax=Aphanomyces astaci TaxID=112090 RepID=W4GAV7_APHAT|nr:hypothetical protein, variant 1 [Aphanomyces astaci]ETV76431.1 hypothetical protein, variant 1 [Aphanomyces astaci]|eukprot:XP_009833977.1 hypothetical protein, variant 1 [Aphanomyces astaci]